MRLYRFDANRGEVLDINVEGAVVTWRVSPVGVHAPSAKTNVEIAAETDELVAQLVARHAGEGFRELDEAALAASLATIEPYASWHALTPATFGTYLQYVLDRPCAAFDRLVASVRSVDARELTVELAGGVELVFGLPLAAEELAREPAPLRRYWARHAVIWAERDGFEVILGRDIGPPEPDVALGQAVQWVMSRGTEQFWFLDGEGRLRLCDLDGGVGDPIDRGLGELWVEAVVDLTD